MSKIEIYDSLLRDGAQSENISFSLQDKLNILKILDEIGIDFIEGGIPISNQKDISFFQEAQKIQLKNSTLVAFGFTRKPKTKCDDDENIKKLLIANTKAIAICGKSWSFQVTDILKTDLNENLSMIGETIEFLKKKNKFIVFDAEHFFDGYKSDRIYAEETLKMAEKAGADRIVLCDTNGISMPDDIFSIINEVKKIVKTPLGIHCHNDSGCATANSCLAVKAGVTQVQGTFLGYGERCGNTNLIEIICNLKFKLNQSSISDENIMKLTKKAREISEICNISLSHFMPYVGASAFAHKGGMHVDGILKNSKSFEHIDPKLVGNTNNILISEFSGKSAVSRLFEDISLINDKICSADIDSFIKEVKKKENLGYQFENAKASFNLLALKYFQKIQPFFELVHYKIIGENPSLSSDKTALAVVCVKVGDREEINAAEGAGPVHALDKALRKALDVFYPCLSEVKLSDYKVRVIESNAATASRVRVLVESQDKNKNWTTVGVSRDIIKASFKAICDSIEYKLIDSNHDIVY